MNDSGLRSERRSAGPAIVLAGLMLLAGYVLSLGPMARLVVQDRISMGTYQTLYAPIVGCGRMSPRIDRAIRSYRGLFLIDNEARHRWFVDELGEIDRL